MDTVAEKIDLGGMLRKAVWCWLIALVLGNLYFFETMFFSSFIEKPYGLFNAVGTLLKLTTFYFLLQTYRALQSEADWRKMDRAIAVLALVIAVLIYVPTLFFIAAPSLPDSGVTQVPDIAFPPMYTGFHMLYVTIVLIASVILALALPVLFFINAHKAKWILITSLALGAFISVFPPQLNPEFEAFRYGAIPQEDISMETAVEAPDTLYDVIVEEHSSYRSVSQTNTMVHGPELPMVLMLAYCFTRPKKKQGHNEEAQAVADTVETQS